MSKNPQNDNSRSEFSYVDISSIGAGPSIIRNGKPIKSIDAPSRARRVIYTNDILFSTVRPNLRAIAKVDANLNGQICSTGFAVFRCLNDVDPDFMLYQLSSTYFILQCMEKVTGGHYPAINDTNLNKLNVILPPISIQYEIAKKLGKLHNNIEASLVRKKVIGKELSSVMANLLRQSFEELK